MTFRVFGPIIAGLLGIAGAAIPGGGVAASQESELQARVWINDGEGRILNRGSRARIYYRASEDANIAIFHIDTNGTVRLVHPRSPEEDPSARGGRDYRVLFPSSSYWYVDDDPGSGYFFVVASRAPLDLSRFRYSHYDRGWDLERVGRSVYGDPYLAMDDYVSYVVPDWEYADYALDFVEYHVGREYDYPRFLCYDCHGFVPYSTWDPYRYTCTNFRVVIYDDPYYYPATRYRGTEVVFARPRGSGEPRFEFKERVRGEEGAPLVVDRSGGGREPSVGVTRRGSTSRTPARIFPRRTQPARGGAGARILPGRRAVPPSAGRLPATGRTQPSARRSDPPRTTTPMPRVRSRGTSRPAPSRATSTRRPTVRSRAGGGTTRTRARPKPKVKSRGKGGGVGV